MSTFKQTTTELHTHLLSMLSADGFVNLLRKYYPITDDALSNPYLSEEIKEDLQKYYSYTPDELSQIVTIHTPVKPPITMHEFFVARRDLLCIFSGLTEVYSFLDMLVLVYDLNKDEEIKNHFYKLYKNGTEKDKDLVQWLVYSEYLNLALEELINQGVEYVEISYANLPTIRNLYIKKEIADKIECRFMLCTNRDNIAFHVGQKTGKAKKVYTYANHAVKALKAGLEWSHEEALSESLSNKQKNIVGFDIMGQETPFSDPELSRSPESERSFYNKLKIILDVLQNDYKDTNKMNTFRIHGGEVPGTDDNILQTLIMLDELAPISPLGHIPPPEIRIGHGVYFKDTQEYFDLLRKYKVIIEINATSNEKLGNIQDITDIRYQRYLAENIPIVIATDGHGLYDTTIVNEDKKALSVVGNDFTKIQNSEKKFLSTR